MAAAADLPGVTGDQPGGTKKPLFVVLIDLKKKAGKGRSRKTQNKGAATIYGVLSHKVKNKRFTAIGENNVRESALVDLFTGD